MQTHDSFSAGIASVITPGIDIERITGIVLAGGRGTRMGSVDKGLQAFEGKPLALHVVERLRPQVGRLAINANRNVELYSGFGFPVWPDELAGFHGPLAGLHTALEHCETEYVVTAPCDSPFIPPDLVARLAEAAAREDADVAVVVTGNEAPYQRQPVFALVKRTLAPSLHRFMAEGGRKVNQWFDMHRTVDVHFADELPFRNINTLEDLRQFETR